MVCGCMDVVKGEKGKEKEDGKEKEEGTKRN